MSKTKFERRFKDNRSKGASKLVRHEVEIGWPILLSSVEILNKRL